MLLQSERLLFGRAQEIFDGVADDLLGEPEKQRREAAGAGIIPKLCPMERVERRKWLN